MPIIARLADERDGNGRRVVVRNGFHQPRDVLTSAGATVPRVNGKRTGPETGERKRFFSAIVPPWAGKTPKITGVLPLLYLHGLSSGDFVPALSQFLGSSAGLSAAVITKLTGTWKAGQRAFTDRDLSAVDCGLWADGIHVNIGLEEHTLCLLVMIGVRADGRKELVALAGGYRESAESWAGLLRDCARRGMHARVLAVGDGALGFWTAVREVFREVREGRCWFRKTASVLAALPKSAHPGAKKALAEIWGAEDKAHALAAVKAFEAACGAKFPKAAAKITDDMEVLLAFCDCPAEHWVRLRMASPVEPAVATVRHRTKLTKGPGSLAAGLAMAFKLIESAQDRWRAVNAPHLVPLARAGARFRTRQTHRTPPAGGRMIFEIHPPETAGPLRIGAAGHDTFETLKQLGVPLVLCPIPGSRAAWGVHRPSGLFIATFFDADNCLETIQFGRPNGNDDTVTWEGINVFGLPAGELLDVLRTRTNIVETDEEDGSSFLAPDLRLTLWRPPGPAGPDDIDNRFIMSIRLSKPPVATIKPVP
jgi:transposase-like protein